MDIFLNYLIQFYLNNTINLCLNSPHCVVLHPQNGDRIVTVNSVTPLHPMYIADMELGHWVTGSVGHLSRPGHRVIILTQYEIRVFSGFRKSPR